MICGKVFVILQLENNQLKQKINWEKLYGKLEKGTYRIVKPVYVNEYVDLYSDEFEIK